MNSDEKISVIIPTCNREQYLTKCLLSLELNRIYLTKVIVINDGTRDITNIIEPFKINLPLVLIQGNQKGATHARNLGLKEIDSEYVAFLDDDSFPTHNWAKALLQTFTDFPLITAQTGRIKWAKPDTKKYKSFIPSYRQKIYDSRHILYQNDLFCKNILDFLKIKELKGLHGIANQLSGGNSAIRMSFIKSKGSFNEFFKTLSDREMAYRIMENKGIIAYNPDMVVYHAHDPSFRRSILRCIKAVPYEKTLKTLYPDFAGLQGISSNGRSGETFVKLQIKTKWNEKIYFIFLKILHKLASVFNLKPDLDPMVRRNNGNNKMHKP